MTTKFLRGDIIRHIPSDTQCICLRVDEFDGIDYVLGQVRNQGVHDNHGIPFLRYTSDEWELVRRDAKG